MKKMVLFALMVSTMFAASGSAQVKQTKQQIMFYTADWKGERFPDGRPRIPDDLLKRAADLSIEDVWDYLRQNGYMNQFEGDWHALHPEKSFVGRALTTQYMPTRPDMAKAETAEGIAEGRIAFNNNNSWPINELVKDDIYVADGYGKIFEGTLIGSNLGSGIAAHSRSGSSSTAASETRKRTANSLISTGSIKGYDPSGWTQEMLISINAPIHIGRATVLPGDLVIANAQGVIFVPAILAKGAIESAEFTGLMDAYNFELNAQGKNGGQFESGWNAAKFAGLRQWIAAHPDKLKMSQADFDAAVTARLNRMAAAAAARQTPAP